MWEVFGEGSRLLEVRRGVSVSFATDRGFGDGELTEVDLRDPLAAGFFELTSGRLPTSPDEVVVNADLASRGPGVGEVLALRGGPERTVVGTVESTSATGRPMVVGPLGAGGDRTDAVLRTWVVDAPAPVTWEQVRALNALGATAVSRAVLDDPPPLPPEAEEALATAHVDTALVTVLALVVAMALMEVVLLAGPAFAVSARRQSRTLALMAAAGGTPRHGRRVVLATGLVLGGLAAAAGTLVGVAAGAAASPLLQQFSDSRFGPFDVPWTHLPLVAGFGMLSASLAAVVPAVVASRQDVVAVLAGRRGDRRPSRRSPVLGVALVGVGVAVAAYGSTRRSGGETLVAASALVTVAGMLLLVPLVVAGVARLGRPAPLTLRYALRDAARHRTRMAPAVAAVAATVAGAVALGIATSSDEGQNEAEYEPQLPMGWAVATGPEVDPKAWSAAARAALPAARVEVVHGVVEEDPEAGTYTGIDLGVDRGTVLDSSWSAAFGSGWLVADTLPLALVDAAAVTPGEQADAEQALAAGGVVVLTRTEARDGQVLIRAHVGSYDGQPEPPTRFERLHAATVPPGPGAYAPAAGVLSVEAARALGVTIAPRAVVISGVEVDARAEADVADAVARSGPDVSLYVERGYVTGGETVVVQLVLFGLGAVLMLGGTLTATFLALSDARPDLATLAAVGASPRRRRGVASAYALVVGGIGAVLGAAVGFVPGIAVSLPLTTTPGDTCFVVGAGGCVADDLGSGPFVDVPWTMIGGLVVALPLFVAAVVWLSARSRLPLAPRLE